MTDARPPSRRRSAHRTGRDHRRASDWAVPPAQVAEAAPRRAREGGHVGGRPSRCAPSPCGPHARAAPTSGTGYGMRTASAAGAHMIKLFNGAGGSLAVQIIQERLGVPVHWRGEAVLRSHDQRTTSAGLPKPRPTLGMPCTRRSGCRRSPERGLGFGASQSPAALWSHCLGRGHRDPCVPDGGRRQGRRHSEPSGGCCAAGEPRETQRPGGRRSFEFLVHAGTAPCLVRAQRAPAIYAAPDAAWLFGSVVGAS